MPGMLRILGHLCCSYFEYFTFFRDISKKKFFYGCVRISPPSNKVMKKNNIVIFPNFFLGFMIEKISYYWLFFGNISIIFQYFWSAAYPIIHWYLANFCEISILRWDIITDQICKNQKYFLADFRFTNLTILQVICVIYANAAHNLLNLCKCWT